MVSMRPVVARATDVCQQLLSIKETPKPTLLLHTSVTSDGDIASDQRTTKKLLG